VPNKNFRPLGASSLVDRALQCAGSVPGTVVLSTDADTTDLSLPRGVRVDHRPAELATDRTPMSLVLSHLFHALGWAHDDLIVLLQPTSLHPRRGGVVREMMRTCTLPVCTVDRYPDRWHPWYAQDAQQPHQPPACRQGLPPRFRPNGLVYLLSGATARRGSFWADHPTFYEMAPGAVLNIDTPDDWAEAERQYGHV